MDDRNQVFDPEFFEELKRRLLNSYRWLEQNAFFGVIILLIVLVLTLIQQVILILIYPLR